MSENFTENDGISVKNLCTHLKPQINKYATCREKCFQTKQSDYFDLCERFVVLCGRKLTKEL